MDIVLNQSEMDELFSQPQDQKGGGGWQHLIGSLQERCDPKTGELELTVDDLERIPRYAFDYGNGGWEAQLVKIFGRHLGPKLGR